MASIRLVKGKNRKFWEIKFGDRSRTPKQKAVRFKYETLEDPDKRARVERKMNVAFHDEGFDPWVQSWDDYKAGRSGDKITVMQAFNQFTTLSERRNYWNTDGTVTVQTNELERFAKFVGPDQPAQIINEQLIADFISIKDYAVRTRNRKLRTIKGFVNWLNEEKGLNIVCKIRAEREPEPKKKFMREDQMLAMAHCYEEHHSDSSYIDWNGHADAWRVMFYMGFRISEMLSMKRKHVGEHWVTVFRKGNKEIELEILPPAKEPLRRLLERTSHPEDQLVPLCVSTFRNKFNEVRDEALDRDARKLKPHSLRHGCATFWLARRVFPSVIQELLSHESIKTTMKYAKNIPGLAANQFKSAWEQGAPVTDLSQARGATGGINDKYMKLVKTGTNGR